MILDSLQNRGRYKCLGPDFVKALAFLKRKALTTLPPGKVAIEGQRIVASMSNNPGKRKANAALEVHRAHADIHYVIEGREAYGWRPLHTCTQPKTPFDKKKDIQFFDDQPDIWVTLSPGQFVVFYPEDTHAPAVGQGEIHKVVIKIEL